MKAVVCTKYGSPDVLELQEIEKPEPQDHEVQIKIHAAPVTAADSMMRKGSPLIGRLFLGLMKPKVPVTGTGFAGVVEAVGKAVKRFKEGDSVCGESVLSFGTHAEYVCVPEEGVLAIKPSNMSYEQAAPLCDGALTSMNFLKDLAKIQSGQKVLINGASGGLGTAGVQLAKAFGAQVIGVCSTANVDLVKSLGADNVTDYMKEDFTKTPQTYDIIYDTVGKSSFLRCKKSLTPKGAYLSPVFGVSHLLLMLWTAKLSHKKAKFSATGIRPASELKVLLKELIELVEAGKIKSVIDRCYSLEQIAQAHHYVDTGHKKGNVVVTFQPS